MNGGPWCEGLQRAEVGVILSEFDEVDEDRGDEASRRVPRSLEDPVAQAAWIAREVQAI